MADLTVGALEAFRAAVMRDAAAQDMLAAIRDPAAFAGSAQRWAEAHGVGLPAGALEAALSSDPAGLHRLQRAPLSRDTRPPLQWLPSAIANRDGVAVVEWMHFAGLPLNDPFFEGSVRAAAGRPFNRLFRCDMPLHAFLAGAAREEALAPSGLIFHMSRCGSTLVSQMLAASDANIVPSEPQPLDDAILLPLQFPVSAEDHVATVRATVAALGRNRSGKARRYFLKLDSWQAMALPLFRLAFPETPWVFLYRDPVEVLVSHQRVAGRQAVPGVLPPQVFGLDLHVPGQPQIEYCARVLARICEAAAAYAGDRGLLVDYSELPDALFTRILPHFGVEPDAGEAALMASAARYHSKSPDAPFTPDSRAKRDEAGAELRTLAERHMSAPYARLEALRGAVSASSPR